ncbi:MAG: VCBS repeat-containing protein [Cyclobacteriaceae bacterium]
MNILDNEFVYNGGGVAVGDLNGDGLDDIFFTGNQVDNELYLNLGDLKFRKITQLAGAQKQKGQWSAGVTMLDINRDGKLDIYVSNTMSPIPDKRKNLLFINSGNDNEGVPHFTEQAREYGLADDAHDSVAAFFDYDNDGDLDLFLAVNLIDSQYPNQFVTRTKDGSSPTCDLLLKAEWDENLKHPVYKDVSLEAGIVLDGYSHSVIINDFNKDGWEDIYVCNDYLSNDILYMNNRDGTFTDRIGEVFKHQSLSAMGSDIADINNDGKEDFITNEMLPYDNKRKKLFINGNSYQTYIFTEQFKYQYQYVRNTLQLNRGFNPETGLPVFSDISFIANVQETDWSWAPLFADFDNDGHRDLLITNGFPRDITDKDFGSFRSGNMSTVISKADLYQMIPEIKIPNFIFKNNGDLTFTDISKKWGIDLSSFSNGAAYADFDKDGDVDFVINNINDKAFFYRNNLNPLSNKNKTGFLRIRLKGHPQNRDAFGATVSLFSGQTIQWHKILSTRGYLSNSSSDIHFGLGSASSIDSVVVVWPDGSKSVVKNPPLNTTQDISFELTSRKEEVKHRTVPGYLKQAYIPGLKYFHEENDFIDFNFQRTLPHKFSQYGPGIAIGDINGDKLEDIIIGGSSRFDEKVFFQKPDGTFRKETFSFKFHYNQKEEDLGLLLFDADNDLDNDLYIVRGSYQHEINSRYYQHVLCVNDGRGNFRIDTLAIGNLRTCGSAVKASDYDGDGDLDLFVGGRVLPHSFPKSDRSFLLRNDSRSKDKPEFKDVTNEVCPELAYIGMVSDAIWTDFNNDNRTDLILATEWGPLTFLRNSGSTFINVTSRSGLADYLGWWNSLSGGDFDNDGDTDYIAGNFGLNTYFKCSTEEPLRLYAKDFDSNGSMDPFISCYWRDSTERKHEYFYHTRDDMVKQLILIRKKFEKYGAFGAATVDQVFSQEELKGAEILETNYLSSAFIENLGDDQFSLTPLPTEAQLAPLYATLPCDLNMDGKLDVLLVGNDYGMELMQGRADAFYGLALINEGGNKFKSSSLEESQFIVPKDARALVKISIRENEYFLATQNRDSLKIFSPVQKGNFQFRAEPMDSWAEVIFEKGDRQRIEFYYGSGFLSQSSRIFRIPNAVKEIIIHDFRGMTRKIIPQISDSGISSINNLYPITLITLRINDR